MIEGFSNLINEFIKIWETWPIWVSILQTIIICLLLRAWFILTVGFFVGVLGINTYGPLGWIQRHIDDSYLEEKYKMTPEYKILQEEERRKKLEKERLTDLRRIKARDKRIEERKIYDLNKKSR